MIMIWHLFLLIFVGQTFGENIYPPTYVHQYNGSYGFTYMASGKYRINGDFFYIRTDGLECATSQSEVGKLKNPKSCFCYATKDKDVMADLCDKKPGFAYVCQNKNDNDHTVQTEILMKIQGVEQEQLGGATTLQLKISRLDDSFVYGTMEVGRKLHAPLSMYAQNPEQYSREVKNPRELKNAYFFDIKDYYVFAQPDKQVKGIELYFPADVNCAKIEYYGLIYGDDLLYETAEEAKMPIYKIPYVPTPITDGGADKFPPGTRSPMTGEIPRPNPIQKDDCENKCCAS